MYRDHLWDQEKVVVVQSWSSFRGSQVEHFKIKNNFFISNATGPTTAFRSTLFWICFLKSNQISLCDIFRSNLSYFFCSDLTENVLLGTINELLNNASYRDRARTMGDLVSISFKTTFWWQMLKNFGIKPVSWRWHLSLNCSNLRS